MKTPEKPNTKTSKINISTKVKHKHKYTVTKRRSEKTNVLKTNQNP